jgi:acyl-CoA thioesterase
MGDEMKSMDDVGSAAIEAIKKRFPDEPYAGKLGLKLLDLGPGHAVVETKFGEDSANMMGGPHGGAIFSLIDSAFELASNSHGTIAVALHCGVSYLQAPRIGDVLRAEAREVSLSRRIATYFIEVRDSAGDLIATCDAMAYRKPEVLPFLSK